MAEPEQQNNHLASKIAAIFDEIQGSHATDNRKLKELSSLRSSSPPLPLFFSAFTKGLTPLFAFKYRSSSAERIIRFVSTFAGLRDSDPNRSQLCHEFLELFLKFLVSASKAANNTVRFRACQIISEIILRLPDDIEVSDELCDDVVDSMKLRVRDKVATVRTYAIWSLSRFVNDSENSDILEAFLEALDSEQSADVRKAILLALPATNATSTVIIECTLDVSESVRKTAYFVLANKFPIQSLSIKQRTVILHRGLSDRSPAVVKECLKLLKDEWLVKCCNSDSVQLLKFLDVETYESVGESVMSTLLSARMVNISDDQRIQQSRGSASNSAEGCNNASNTLLEPEFALYWRTVCGHLQREAEAKGSDAAATTGTEAEMYAAEASDINDLLEKVLPATVSDYVELVKAHLDAGPDYRFVARQLLLLGKLLDYSDAAHRRVASAFVQDLLNRTLDYEVDSNGDKIIVGDGISFGGDSGWANAVSGLSKKVHAASGEFEEVILGVVAELVAPCRERAADFLQWMHCLAVSGLLLENTRSFQRFQGKAIEPIELLNSLLLPGAKHPHVDVQRVAIRCLGLYGLLERKPSEELVKQLRLSFARSLCPISVVAGKALFDLLMWHGPEEMDRATGLNLPAEDLGSTKSFYPIDLSDPNSDLDVGILHLLYAGLDRGHWEKLSEYEDETVQAALGEGFAKILLMSENYPSIPASLHSLFLSRIIQMYFFDDRKELERLKQCLSVFFELYPQRSVNHKKHLSRAFVAVVRGMWPGIYGNPNGSSVMVSKLRKQAVQATRFMIQMMQKPIYAKAVPAAAENSRDDNLRENEDGSAAAETSFDFESGEEGLAIRIATEVASFPGKRTAAEKSYLSALCKAATLLGFRSSEKTAIKLMRILLNSVMNSVSLDKEVVKELRSMGARLRMLDMNPDQELTPEQANAIFERLELENPGLETTSTVELPPPTPAASRSARTKQPRRRVVRREEISSDEEEESSPTSVVPASVAAISSSRAQRASKTAALTKMTASKAPLDLGEEIEEGEEEGECSELTSEEESEESTYNNEEE